MCDSDANSGNILTGEPPISAAPPLILLQSEEESCDQKKAAAPVESESTTAEATKDNTDLSSGHDPSVTTATTVSSVPSSSSTWSSGERTITSESVALSATVPSGSVSAPSADLPWNLDHQLPELFGGVVQEKNPLSELTEEHLSRLDDVLASAEVARLLQQTHLGGLNVGLGADSVGVTPSSSNTSHPAASISGLCLPDAGQLSDDSLKLDLFENQPSGSDLPIDETLVHNYIEDSVREYESAMIMSAAVSDHAYAMPTTTTTTVPSTTTNAMPSTTTSKSTAIMVSPRKSARIKQRMDDGKNAFEYDSDFEYYFTPSRRNVKKDIVSEQSDVEKTTSSPASSSPAASTPAKQKQPKRRSTRIVDLENREKAEKILQENRQEALAAQRKQKEEEEAKLKEGDEPKKDEESSPSTPKRGRKLGKKATAAKGKKGKQKQEEGKAEEEESEDTGTPKARRPKPIGKATPTTPKGKKAKKKKEAASAEEEMGAGAEEEVVAEENGGENNAAKKDVSPQMKSAVRKPLIKKKKLGKAAGKAEGPDRDKGQGKLKKAKVIKGKKVVKIAQAQQKQDSSDEDDDIPLQAIAKISKNEDSKEKNKTVTPKPKKNQKQPTPSKTASQANDKEVKKKMKQLVKAVHRKRTISENSEGKTGSKPKEKKTESSKASNHEQISKAESETVGKTAEKTGEKGSGNGGKGGEVMPSVVKPVKHKHRKSEDVVIDMTVTDLFKPDGVIPTEHLKKEADVSDTKDGMQASTDVKKTVHGTPVGKTSDDVFHSKTHSGTPHGRSSVDSKNHSGTPHGRSSSADIKSHSGIPHGPNSAENKNHAGTPHERSSSSDSKGHSGTPHARSSSTDSKIHSGTPHRHSSSTDSKSHSGTPHGHSSSVDHKNHSGTLHGRSFSVDSKSHAGTPHGGSLSVEGKNTSHTLHGKGVTAEDKSSSKVSQSGEGQKGFGDAGPDRKGAVQSLLTKQIVTLQAATNAEHKETAEKPSYAASAHVKTEKEHIKSGHSEHKEQRRHSDSKKQKNSASSP